MYISELPLLIQVLHNSVEYENQEIGIGFAWPC